MSDAAVALLCAAVAGVLGLLVPLAIGRLPEPEDATPVAGEPPKEPYAAIARLDLLGPGAGAVSAVVAGVFGLRFGDDRVLAGLVPLVPVLVLLAVVDWRTRLLPRVVVLPATGVGLALVIAEWAATQETHVVVRSVVAMLVARSFFWVLWFVRQAGMGFGDVRLAALIGLALGRLGWDEWIVGLYGGLVIFALFGLARALVRRSRAALKHALPYGPFMTVGLVLGVVTSGAVSVLG